MKSNVSGTPNLSQLNNVVEVLAMTQVLNWEFVQLDNNNEIRFWSATLIGTFQSGSVCSTNAQLSFERFSWVV